MALLSRVLHLLCIREARYSTQSGSVEYLKVFDVGLIQVVDRGSICESANCDSTGHGQPCLLTHTSILVGKARYQFEHGFPFSF